VKTAADAAHAGFSLSGFYTLKMVAIRSSEMSIYTLSTRRHIQGDSIVHSHRRENLKSYISFVEYKTTLVWF
jgi:hypothetical protein